MAVATALTGLAIYSASAREATKPSVAPLQPAATDFVATARAARPQVTEAPVNSDSQSVDTANLPQAKPPPTRMLRRRVAAPTAKPPAAAPAASVTVPQISGPGVEKEPGRSSETLRPPGSDFQ